METNFCKAKTAVGDAKSQSTENQSDHNNECETPRRSPTCPEEPGEREVEHRVDMGSPSAKSSIEKTISRREECHTSKRLPSCEHSNEIMFGGRREECESSKRPLSCRCSNEITFNSRREEYNTSRRPSTSRRSHDLTLNDRREECKTSMSLYKRQHLCGTSKGAEESHSLRQSRKYLSHDSVVPDNVQRQGARQAVPAKNRRMRCRSSSISSNNSSEYQGRERRRRNVHSKYLVETMTPYDNLKHTNYMINNRRSRSRSRFTYDSDSEPLVLEREKRRRFIQNLKGKIHYNDKRISPLPGTSDRNNNLVNRRKRKHYHDSQSNNEALLEKLLNILKETKCSNNSRLSMTNVIPEFDPLNKNQTMLSWLTKVEECAEIYNWEEKEIIHLALPKLRGIAKSWYEGLSTVLYSWNEWKKKLLESFPFRDDYAELLSAMLAKKTRIGESLELYYYGKMNLINRCGISGRKAVDCLLHGIEDRAIKVGAQAVQFREPEDVLKYLKTVKVGMNNLSSDKFLKFKREKRMTTFDSSTKRNEISKDIICHNCNEKGHKSFVCSKSSTKCVVCGKLGHLSQYCRLSKDYQNKNVTDYGKCEKHIAKLISNCDTSNEKYVLKISVNNKQFVCYVDLGSESTLIRQSESKFLNLQITSNNLPLLRGVGGHLIKPLGKSDVYITIQGICECVEVLIVEDYVLKYPVLLGHTFTEKPGIVITKTSDEIIFEKVTEQKLFLKLLKDIDIPLREIVTLPVDSGKDVTCKIYVSGSVRGDNGKEYYLMPGEYSIINGKGCLLVINLTDSVFSLKKGILMTRTVPMNNVLNVAIVELESSDTVINCGPQMTNEQRCQLRKVLKRFSTCFSSGLSDLGLTTAYEMKIELENSEPVVYKPYRMSFSERNLVRNMVNEMLDAGIVKESSSPYASPIVLVQKKTGEKRLCVDYRALNRRTKKNHFPLPRIEDQLDRLAGNSLFISLDLASGYYQIPIEECSQEKTAFITPDGHYEYTRMPFGLVNAPAVFQKTMNSILSEAKIKYALVYIDDVLIPAKDFEEGLVRLEEVLTLLQKGGLTLKLVKCNFFYTNIEFLGFEVSSEGIKPGLKKTNAVAKFPAPTNIHELRQFIGLASFFRRFIQGFATIARPLTDLLKKNCEWKWSKGQSDAFNSLKEALINRPILALYDPNRETQIHTDASKQGIAGILLQKSDDGIFKPVSYFSRKTTPDEQKFHSFELETLAIVATLSKFRVYLLGIRFKIYTDCNALRTTLVKRDLVTRIARWWVQLQEYDCEIEYRAGSNMTHADALSRNPVDDAAVDDHVLDIFTLNIEDWIATVQSNDEEILRIKQILGDPMSKTILDVVRNYKLKNGKIYRIMGEDEDNVRWVVPKGVRWQVVKMNHDDIGHFGFEKTLNRIQKSFWFSKMRRFIKKYVQSCLECAHSKAMGMLHPIPKVEIPFHTIHADHLGPFVRSAKGNVYLFIIVDSFTKYVSIKPVRNTKSNTSIKIFREHFSYFGTPTRLITDQGTSFTSNSFRSFVKSQGIKHILNAVATPRANGQVERFNRTILEALSAKCHDKDDKNWDDFVPDIQLGLNTTVHKTTGKSPSELLFGFKLKGGKENILSEVIDETTTRMQQDDLAEMRVESRKLMTEQQIKDQEKYNKKRKPSHHFKIGDLVSVRREQPSDGKSKKLMLKYQGPYRILKVLPHDRFLVEDTPLTRKHGKKRYKNVVAIDKLKPWLSFSRDFESSSDSETK